MRRVAKWLLMRFYISLIIVFVILFTWHITSFQQRTESLSPQSIYQLNLNIKFEQDDDIINIETYIPQDDERQQIIQESAISNGLGYLVTESEKGRVAQWSGRSTLGAVQYKSLLRIEEVNYQISSDLTIPKQYPKAVEGFLFETEAIQVTHPELRALWQQIKPNNDYQILATLRAIYDYTHLGIEGAPFKGYTDALTAL